MRNEIKTKLFFLILFVLEIVKIWKSPYAHFNFTNLCINTDVLSPMEKSHQHMTGARRRETQSNRLREEKKQMESDSKKVKE